MFIIYQDDNKITKDETRLLYKVLSDFREIKKAKGMVEQHTRYIKLGKHTYEIDIKKEKTK